MVLSFDFLFKALRLLLPDDFYLIPLIFFTVILFVYIVRSMRSDRR